MRLVLKDVFRTNFCPFYEFSYDLAEGMAGIIGDG